MTERNFEQGIDGEPSKADVITWHLEGYKLDDDQKLLDLHRSYERSGNEENTYWAARFLSQEKASHACRILLA